MLPAACCNHTVGASSVTKLPSNHLWRCCLKYNVLGDLSRLECCNFCEVHSQNKQALLHSPSMSWSHQHPSDGMSDGVLSESAQLRSALQAKTYLQALSPDERRRLLKGTKLSGEPTAPCAQSVMTESSRIRHSTDFAVQVIDASITLLLWLLLLLGGMSFSSSLTKTKTDSLTIRPCWRNSQM